MEQKKKTIGDWLKMLGHPYRKQAIKNCYMPLDHISYASDLPQAITMAFDWAGSPEGYDYWNNYRNYLANKSNDPQANN